MNEAELFSGRWRFDPDLSNLSSSPPKSWIQEIAVRREEISVTERITRPITVRLSSGSRARFDGIDYAVEGSPAIDEIAYTRVDRHTISGIGKKNGIACLTETVLADPVQSTLTLTYNYRAGGRIVAHGQAVFQQDCAPPPTERAGGHRS